MFVGEYYGINSLLVDVCKKLISEGKAYPCFMSEEEISEIREGQELRKEAIGIYGVYAVDRDLSLEEVKKHLDNGDRYVIRMKSPGDMHNEIVLHDMIKGDIVLPENIIDEVRELAKDGFKEIILIGINLGAYGEDLETEIFLEDILRYPQCL